jgi:uncharacterized protein (DUF488 family)
MIKKILTIGAYGFSETRFFQTLTAAHTSVFCDLRARRGMRGPTYAFANSSRLQMRLDQLGIKYLHIKELAPSDTVRSRQQNADAESDVLKRDRKVLADAFTHAYTNENLSTFDSKQFATILGDGEQVIALFCVEQAPMACHRSLVADRLSHDLGIQVEHLMP